MIEGAGRVLGLEVEIFGAGMEFLTDGVGTVLTEGVGTVLTVGGLGTEILGVGRDLLDEEIDGLGTGGLNFDCGVGLLRTVGGVGILRTVGVGALNFDCELR